MRILLFLILLVLLLLAALALWRWSDLRRDRAEMDRLRGLVAEASGRFDPAMVADLPAPARRFFEGAIRPGTPLYRVAEIEMTGRFDLGSLEAPRPLEMQARQVLAGVQGFLWQARMRGGMRVSGSDSEGWTRFWLAGLIPVARVGGDADHRRSAFGRSVAEAVIWLPSSVLPQPGVTWEAVDDQRARVTITRDGMEQSAEITLNAAGHAVEITLPRWSNANSEKTYRVQPFGGTLSDHREVGGLVIPFAAEVGNHVGTADYFPFFKARLTDVRFPGLADSP
ncbi:DUF6544 family protein [Pseudooceanicola sp.]|uniref:DUF6544 family protein n=1 Tax=Pseudooceanicola sp. TaxID=1914328 RepID=UPI0035C757DB